MTNAELVERVAREVLQYTQVSMGTKRTSTTAFFPIEDTEFGVMWQGFDPLNDMNDLFMVLEKFDEYNIDYKDGEFMVALWADGEGFVSFANTLSLAVLQAALKAKGANNGTE